jgi:hypothetical protein
MKNFLLLAGLVLAGGTARAQIVQEQRYNTQLTVHKLSTGAVKYAGFFTGSTGGQVRIYNNDHSLYRQVPVSLPAGAQPGPVLYVSDNLFNSNATLEMVVNFTVSNAAYSQAMRIIDETGAQLLALDSTSYPQVYNTPLGAKMLTNYYTSTRQYSKIYSLPGTYTALKTTPASQANELAPFPNPATTQIALPYALAPGQQGELTVTNAGGQLVRRFTVDSTFDKLLFDTQGLAPGLYLYQLQTAGKTSAPQRFVVQ